MTAEQGPTPVDFDLTEPEPAPALVQPSKLVRAVQTHIDWLEAEVVMQRRRGDRVLADTYQHHANALKEAM